jgi:hypothetical protein
MWSYFRGLTDFPYQASMNYQAEQKRELFMATECDNDMIARMQYPARGSAETEMRSEHRPTRICTVDTVWPIRKEPATAAMRKADKEEPDVAY